jgi:hypothetical protein
MIRARFSRFHTSREVVWKGVEVWKERHHTNHHTLLPPFRGGRGVEVWRPDQVVVGVVWKHSAVWTRLARSAVELFSASPLWISYFGRQSLSTGPEEARAMVLPDTHHTVRCHPELAHG